MRTVFFTIFLCSALYAQSKLPDWSVYTSLGNGESFASRENIYQLEEDSWSIFNQRGLKHALIYPVATTELLIPIDPLKYFFQTDQKDPIRQYVFSKLKDLAFFDDLEGMFSWLGLHTYPKYKDEGSYEIPQMSPQVTQYPMGATIIEREGAKGMTFSCAACHSGNLFGKRIIGLTNRFPRANRFFHMGKQGMKLVNSHLFKLGLKATESERQMLRQTQNTMHWVGTKPPQALGLDTTLAQISLSLARRGTDEYATKYIQTALFPRKHPLETLRADSKPAVWWNLKYKTKWLSDGSIIAGNPILLNFLWNEIGRGADLKKLEQWLKDNPRPVKELTSAAFATQAPRYTDFFPTDAIDINKAKKGEKLFVKNCQGCHGQYQKNWSLSDNSHMTSNELLENHRVVYHDTTPIKNVGTDPLRAQGIGYLAERMNELKIAKWMGMKVQEQKGYVPQPLVGIWARWPYFHNNSIPNLCALMTAPSKRPQKFWMGEALDKETDYDSKCAGYPLGKDVPKSWKESKEYLYDTTKAGLSNSGHYQRIFTDKSGNEKFSWEEKFQLIEFLKTL